MVTLEILLVLHCISVSFMTGLIWFVQVVHYPLFKSVGSDQFPEYHRAHMRLTGYIVGPVMLVEICSAAALVPLLHYDLLPIFNLLGLIGIWLTTFGIQVPLHEQLKTEYSAKTITLLVLSNWIRTVLWSLRAPLAFFIALQS